MNLKKIIISILLVTVLNANYYIITPATSVVTIGNIDGKEYLILKTALYQKNEYFELIYSFPRNVNKASIKNNIIYTDQGNFQITKEKIIILDKNPEYIFNSPVNNLDKYLIKKKINNVLFIADLDNDSTKEIIYKYNDRLYIGTLIKDNSIIQPSTEAKISQIKYAKNKLPELQLKYKNKNYLLKKRNNIWQQEIIAQNRMLNLQEIAKFEPDELEYMRFEILARNGYIFKQEKIQKLFSSQPWYKPNPAFSEKKLNDIEKENLKLLFKIEDQKRRAALKDKPQIITP